MFMNLTTFSSVSNLNGFIQLASVMILHEFINSHLWSILISVLVSNLLVSDLKMLLWLIFLLLKAFFNCKDNVFNPYLMCDRMAVI